MAVHNAQRPPSYAQLSGDRPRMYAISVDGYNLATFHLVKCTNNEEIQEYMNTSETKYKKICISYCMFSVRAAELSVPAELSRFWTNHEPGNEHMQGGIRMDSSLFSYREGRGPLADHWSSLYENEGEDAGASSSSHMRNYLATIDRLPAKQRAVFQSHLTITRHNVL